MVAWPHALSIHEIERGDLVEVWPPGSLSRTAPALPIAPRLFPDGAVAIDPEGERLVWLYSANLMERCSAYLREFSLEGMSETRSILTMSVADDGSLLAVIGDGRKTLIAAIDSEGNLSSQRPAPEGRLIDLVRIDDACLAVIDDGLSRLVHLSASPEEPLAFFDLPIKVDRLWPAPDGRYLIATADGAPTFLLINVNGGVDEALRLTLQGAYLDAAQDRAEGWRFWDLEAPDLEGARPLSGPSVAWLENSSLAALGTVDGPAALIDPGLNRAHKLMTPPDEILLPMALRPPGIFCLGQGKVAWLVPEGLFDDSERPLPTAVSENSDSDPLERTPESGRLWLRLMIGGLMLAVLFLVLIWFGSGGD